MTIDSVRVTEYRIECCGNFVNSVAAARHACKVVPMYTIHNDCIDVCNVYNAKLCPCIQHGRIKVLDTYTVTDSVNTVYCNRFCERRCVQSMRQRRIRSFRI